MNCFFFIGKTEVTVSQIDASRKKLESRKANPSVVAFKGDNDSKIPDVLSEVILGLGTP